MGGPAQDAKVTRFRQGCHSDNAGFPPSPTSIPRFSRFSLACCMIVVYIVRLGIPPNKGNSDANNDVTDSLLPGHRMGEARRYGPWAVRAQLAPAILRPGVPPGGKQAYFNLFHPREVKAR